MSGGLRIGIDARAAAEVPAGRGRYVRELLRGLARLDDDHRYELWSRAPVPELELDSRFAWRTVAAPDPVWHLRTALAVNRSADVFLSTNSYLTAWFTRVPTALVVYDMVAFRPGARAQKRAQRIERATLRPALRRAALSLCISEATERDLVELFPRARGRTAVVPLAADDLFGASVAERQLGKEYVLSTGTLEPRKNLGRLIEAYAGLPDELRSRFDLVLVGPRGWEADEVYERAGAAGEGVRLLGFVPDDELAALYQGAALFAYPSLYEGFGLPVLEAMKAGAPVITSDVSSLPEVAGDAARYVDPLSVSSIREALVEVLTNDGLRRELSERGRARSAAFSWERTARETLDHLCCIRSDMATERNAGQPSSRS